MVIRRADVTDIPWFLVGAVGNSVSYLLNTSPRSKYGLVISQFWVLASHKTKFESVAHGA